MKKTLKTMAIAAAAMILSGITIDCAAQADSLNVKVTNIKTLTGKIMIATGDYTDPMQMVATMVPADGESVECTLRGKIEPGDQIHVFHDANGNFKLDTNKDGIPVEGCYSGPMKTDENGIVAVGLLYPAEAENQ